jgi:MFS transporter, DHA3 family, macrolide efflux protein
VTIEVEEDVRLLKNARFRRLLESRLVGQTAQNALLYALLILLVKHSGSSIHSTLLVVALTVPAILFGIPAGTLADYLPRRLSLTVGYLTRAGIAMSLVFFKDDLLAIYALVLVYATIGQLFAPAEQAAVPTLVRREQLGAANSLMMLVLILGQIGGIVLIAPFLIWLIAPEAVFPVCAGLFLIAAYIIGFRATDFEPVERVPRVAFMEATREGFRILRTDRRAYLAVVYLMTAIALSRVLIILLPKYTRETLQAAPEDTVFIAAPAAIGAAIGLVLVPVLAKIVGAWRVVLVGFFVLVLGMIALGLLVYVRDAIVQNYDFGIGYLNEKIGVSSAITAAMILAVPIGFAYVLVAVGARVVMNEHAPPEAQGRVFAVQMAIGDTLSLVPLLLVGVVADLVGARGTLLVSAIAALVGAGYLTFSHRWGPQASKTREVIVEPGAS